MKDKKETNKRQNKNIDNRLQKKYKPEYEKDYKMGFSVKIKPVVDLGKGLSRQTIIDISKYKNSDEVLGIYNDYNTKQLNEYMVSKQSDTVMLLYLFRDLFDYETRKKNFVF